MQEASHESALQENPPLKLTGEMLRLTELLAENHHDSWTRERAAQGWKFGSLRDEEKKEHPNLVPYAQLPDWEKQIQRTIALESIQRLLALDYSKRTRGDVRLSSEKDSNLDARNVIAGFKKPQLTLAELRRLWTERAPIVWLRNAEIYRRAVDACLRLGESFLAFDIAAEGLETFQDDLRLIQLQALALARTGATRRANTILQDLRSSGHDDEETLGLLARTYKDFWLIAMDSKEKSEHLKMSFELYAEAYRRNHGYYSGINAASMGFISGEIKVAQELARDVTAICNAALQRLSSDDEERDWVRLTLAEASLILGDLSVAEQQYKDAVKSSRQSWASLNRARAQARFLLENSGYNPTFLDHCFALPRVVVSSGHMFDKLNRPQPRFPHELEARTRREIDAKLSELGAQVGFCSLACGADMIFAEAILARGGDINIVLPFEKEIFKQSSVEIVPGLNLASRFENILENAATVTILSELGASEDGAVYEYCNQALIGLALLRGQFLGIDVVPLAVWDGRSGDGRGGTHSFVEYWERRGAKIELIRLDKILAEEIEGGHIKPGEPGHEVATGLPAEPAPYRSSGETIQISHSTPPVSAQEIKAILVADIVGYTRLAEAQIPLFATHFLGKVAALMESSGKEPIVKNTWGDAIYCVFDHVSDAGIFALRLRDLVHDNDWTKFGLPNDLTIRIALHAGPAHPCFDPVLRRLTFLGSHVNRTARIEPIAEEGQIYASQAFAALVAAEGVKELVCDYVGQRQLAKSFGAFPVFLVRRARGTEHTLFYRKF